MTVALFPYQQEAIERAVARNGVYNFLFDMRCGKSRCAIITAQRMQAEACLITMPLSAVAGWKRELPKVWPEAHILDLTHGLIKKRAEKLKKAIARPLVVLCNWDAYWREPLRSAITEFGFDAWLGDELHRIRKRSAKRAMYAHTLARHVRVRLGLTGSIMPHGPEDLYSQYKAISPDVFGTRWAEFAGNFINFGGYFNHEITGYRNLPVIEQRLQQTSSRVTIAEAMPWLPPEYDEPLAIELTPETRRHYDAMEATALAQIEGIDPATGRPAEGLVLARITLTNLLRLQTIASGFAKTRDGNIINFGTEKLDILTDLLADIMYNSSQHAVVYARFTHDVDRIAEAAAQFGPVYALDGRSTQRRRDEMRDAWEQGGGIIVSQIATTEGKDFAAAYRSIFYSLDFDLVNYMQSRARLTHPDQKNAITHYLLIAQRTVDQKIYNMLAQRENLSTEILDRSRARALLSSR